MRPLGVENRVVWVDLDGVGGTGWVVRGFVGVLEVKQSFGSFAVDSIDHAAHSSWSSAGCKKCNEADLLIDKDVYQPITRHLASKRRTIRITSNHLPNPILPNDLSLDLPQHIMIRQEQFDRVLLVRKSSG